MHTGDIGERRSGLVAESRSTPVPQQFVNRLRQAEDVGTAIPLSAGGAFGRGVRTPDRRRHTHLFERTRNSQSSDARIVGRYECVAQMKCTMHDLCVGREIERCRNLSGDSQRIRRRCGGMHTEHRVDGIGRDKILRKVRVDTRDAGGNRRSDCRVRQIGVDDLLKLSDEAVYAVGRQIEAKEFDRDEPVLLRVVGAKYGTKGASTDLMKDAKRTERFGVDGAGSFRVQ